MFHHPEDANDSRQGKRGQQQAAEQSLRVAFLAIVRECPHWDAQDVALAATYRLGALVTVTDAAFTLTSKDAKVTVTMDDVRACAETGWHAG